MQNDSRRFAYLDNLRSFVIFLVVVMHSNVTYSGYGGWYYKEASSAGLDIVSRILFGLYGSFTQAWFMGILFFLAAYFAAKSLAKRGPAAFVRERLFRLGIPLLIYMFVIDPFIGYFIMNYGDIRGRFGAGRAYLGYLGSFRWIGSTGPLWFVEALLLFSLPYAALRALRPAKKALADPPKALTFVLIILATGFAAFSIRLFMPIGTERRQPPALLFRLLRRPLSPRPARGGEEMARQLSREGGASMVQCGAGRGDTRLGHNHGSAAGRLGE